MDAETATLEPLLQQWRELPAGDRKGILQRLPVEQRLAFRRILASSVREDSEAALRAQRFRGYSPWLGELLDACEKDEAAATALKPSVRAGLLAGHELAAESGEKPDEPLSFTVLAQSLLTAARKRL